MKVGGGGERGEGRKGSERVVKGREDVYSKNYLLLNSLNNVFSFYKHFHMFLYKTY